MVCHFRFRLLNRCKQIRKHQIDVGRPSHPRNTLKSRFRGRLDFVHPPRHVGRSSASTARSTRRYPTRLMTGCIRRSTSSTAWYAAIRRRECRTDHKRRSYMVLDLLCTLSANQPGQAIIGIVRFDTVDFPGRVEIGHRWIRPLSLLVSIRTDRRAASLCCPH